MTLKEAAKLIGRTCQKCGMQMHRPLPNAKNELERRWACLTKNCLTYWPALPAEKY